MNQVTVPICIRRQRDGRIIARADSPEQVVALEGNLYFHPDCVDRELLKTSDRLYTCPYKGTCNWVDMKLGDLYINDVSWIYPDPEPDYRRIAGWYGFYRAHTSYDSGECGKS